MNVPRPIGPRDRRFLEATVQAYRAAGSRPVTHAAVEKILDANLGAYNLPKLRLKSSGLVTWEIYKGGTLAPTEAGLAEVEG